MSTKSDLIASRAYLGHPKSQSNPKTRKYWLDVHHKMVILDPEVIEEQIKAAREKFQKAKKAGKEILLICEKELYRKEIKKLAEDAGIHYLNYKVPAGVLTNFDTLLSRIRSLNEMRLFVESEAYNMLTKKEQQMRERKLAKIEQVYKGVVNLRSMPDLVVIVDGQFMDKFVNETEKLDVDSIILASSNFNRRSDDKQLVMCNVNGKNSIDYVLKSIIQ